MLAMEFSIWLASKTSWVHLTKTINLHAVPRIGEHIKFQSMALGDYFGWKVTDIIHRENGKIEVWTELLDNIDDRMYSFEDDCEFQQYLEAYESEGWTSPVGVRKNPHFRNVEQ